MYAFIHWSSFPFHFMSFISSHLSFVAISFLHSFPAHEQFLYGLTSSYNQPLFSKLPLRRVDQLAEPSSDRRLAVDEDHSKPSASAPSSPAQSPSPAKVKQKPLPSTVSTTMAWGCLTLKWSRIGQWTLILDDLRKFPDVWIGRNHEGFDWTQGQLFQIVPASSDSGAFRKQWNQGLQQVEFHRGFQG